MAVVRANYVIHADTNGNPGTSDRNSSSGLNTGAVAGIVVGSVAGGLILVLLLGLLIRCYCQRRRKVAEKPEAQSVSKPKLSRPLSSSVWTFPTKGASSSSSTPTKGKRVPSPMFPLTRLDDDGEVSDTSFVLPELGGPNPHNKFDGMEWVDIIKGMDDDVLVDISMDLRKYKGHQGRSQ